MEISQAKFECSNSRKKAKEEEKIKKLEEFEAAEEEKKQQELANNESLYIDDPEKALKNWFEREGYELDFKVEEKGYS